MFRILPLLLAVLPPGCAARGQDSVQITHIRRLDGQSIGVMTGSTFDQHTGTCISDGKKECCTSYADMALAVGQGEIAAFLMDEPWPGCCVPRTRA